MGDIKGLRKDIQGFRVWALGLRCQGFGFASGGVTTYVGLGGIRV